MTPQDEATKIEGYLTAVWAALEARGATIPPEKNTTNLGEAVRSLPGGGGEEKWDPSNPTVGGLKAAALQGIDVAIGTEIPDKWNGNDNPLIVAQKLDSSNNAKYPGAEGYICVRKYVEPLSQLFDNSSVLWSESAVFQYLQNEYLTACSDALKSVLTDISPCTYEWGYKYPTSKWFLMSCYEVCNQGSSDSLGYEGIMWDYWKNKTGLSSPDGLWGSNSGRVMQDRDGSAQTIWLRSLYSGDSMCVVGTSGDVVYQWYGGELGILPACFIGKEA